MLPLVSSPVDWPAGRRMVVQAWEEERVLGTFAAYMHTLMRRSLCWFCEVYKFHSSAQRFRFGEAAFWLLTTVLYTR